MKMAWSCLMLVAGYAMVRAGVAEPAVDAAPPPLPRASPGAGQPLKLIFTGTNDVFDVRGKLEFNASGLEFIGQARGLPPAILPYAVPRPDGSYLVFSSAGGVHEPWTLWRCRTVDGLTYENAEVVYVSRPGDWVRYTTYSYRPEDDSIIVWKMEKAGISHAVRGFVSRDAGTSWQPLAEAPAFHDHDALTIRWDARTRQYVEYQNTMQAWNRKYGDNLGTTIRRVLTIRTSPDGLAWTPDQDAGYSPTGPLHPVANLITPDATDPEDLQFYMFRTFPYADRYLGMMLNYAPSPDVVNPAFPASRHGPQLSGEWWVSPDGLRWERPYRDDFAPGEAPTFIWHEPMRIGGRLLWVFDRGIQNKPGACEDEVYGLPEDRLCQVGSLCNAEFTTRAFTMPAEPLTINAAIGFLGRQGKGWDQGYLMVELTDDHGRPIPGYEPEQCVWRSTPGLTFRPSWNGKSGAELAGQPVALKFYLRDARVYTVTVGGRL